MTRRVSLILALAAVVPVEIILGGGPVHAQMLDPVAPVSCRGFERIGSGGWRATEATTLAYSNGLVINLRPGEIAMPGQLVAGVDIAAMLDRQCGAEPRSPGSAVR